jgi:hypothetical protein
MLTIPANILEAPGEPRRLMRRSFAGLLPPMVLNRKSKGSFASTFHEAFLPCGSELLNEPGEIQVVERGYVDRPSLLSRLEKFTQGLECNETQLRQILLLEFWLRKRMTAPPPPEQSPRPPEVAVS